MNANPIMESLKENPLTLELMKPHGQLGYLSTMEEALLLTAAFQQDQQTRIIVKKNKYEAQQLYSRLAMLENEVVLFAMDESLRLQALASSPEDKNRQVSAMVKMRQDYPKIIITNVAAFSRFLPSVKYFDENCLEIQVGMEISKEKLIAKLNKIGYTKMNYVEIPCTYAARGGILDVYSLNYPDPIRIEFFDQEVDSIRFFNAQTQRTVRTVKEATLVPASDILFTDKQLKELSQKIPELLEAQLAQVEDSGKEMLEEAIEKDLEALKSYDPQSKLYRYYGLVQADSILDYVPEARVVYSTVEGVEERARKNEVENVTYIQEEVQDLQSLKIFNAFHPLYQLEKRVQPQKIYELVPFDHPIESGIQTLDAPHINYLEWVPQEAKKDNVYFSLEKEDINLLSEKLDTSGFKWLPPIFYQGFSTPSATVYTRREIFRHLNRKVPYQKTFSQSTALHDILELEPGDYIVHAEHGIGQYLGVETRETQGVKKDYLHMVYRGGDDLYVPISQFQLIRKYVSKEGVGTKLSKLGSGEWEKTKNKVNKKVEEIASHLVELYAARSENIGFAFPKDDILEREFDEAFEFESTPDQLQATAEIKAEMEKPKPMDHLLIGDVGYGKTEVAMRCAFKAVCAGKQVAFLCPTTILSMQHYQTLQKRFESIGTKVALVNRFTPTKEMKRIQQGLKDGSIEIVVGTHRLFSKSLEFKDLGFLIIDEEQRFGVGHKEKIKEMKNSIDVLALSATPIPRTLQMSLIGVRTISQLNTPPAHRHPIQTYLMEEKGPVIEEIIQRELSRSGQVFFLHNRIEDIFITAAELQRKFPDVSIGVAHGRMSRTEIEDVMLDFAQGKYQILVCTTIIETGLDIANANTIIIENADRFGLAQLYQIRGRVGRREKLAYCYLMVPAQKQLSEASSKRLKSIKEFTQLGSGYKIAMRDLTIRGAGDMLGSKQAGFIDSVGLDMYLDMLSQAIAKKQANALQTPQEEPEEKLASLKTARIKMEGYIPKQFTSNDGDKLDLYQHIRALTSEKALLEYEKETTDLFGQIPKEVQALFDAKWLDLFASRSDIQAIEENDGSICITLSDHWAKRVDGRKFFEGSSSLLSGVKSQFKNVNGLVQVSFEKKKNYLTLLKRFEGLLDNPAYFKKGS